MFFSYIYCSIIVLLAWATLTTSIYVHLEVKFSCVHLEVAHFSFFLLMYTSYLCRVLDSNGYFTTTPDQLGR
jgi:hypothetical protein